jgi:hypothetical protein
MEEWFDFRNHFCLVFPMLGLSLYDYMLSTHFAPFPLNTVKHITAQLLRAVACTCVHVYCASVIRSLTTCSVAQSCTASI